ncbi:MAG: Crp/Fnr family transcriptional regulator [Bacillota bacterium]|nr:Crp/Fnr family transcriptional regulator [Bacillota bacterium]
MPLNKSILELLAKTPLFRGVDLELLLADLNPRLRSYQKGETVVHAGDRFDGLGIVIEGQVLVLKDGIAGERSVFADLGRGDMFGEMACFLDVRVWPATVTAQEKAKILFVSPENVIRNTVQVTEEHRKLVQNMLAFMAKRAIMLNRRLEILSNRTIRGKIAAYLLGQMSEQGGMSMVHLSMTRHELADYLNVTRPSLSRELAAMQREGIIEYYRSSIKILDLGALSG